MKELMLRSVTEVSYAVWFISLLFGTPLLVFFCRVITGSSSKFFGAHKLTSWEYLLAILLLLVIGTVLHVGGAFFTSFAGVWFCIFVAATIGCGIYDHGRK